MSERLAASLGAERVVGGLCHMLSQVEEPGVIRWAGARPAVTISALRPEQVGGVDACAAALRRAGVRVEVTDAIATALWSKLLFVAPFGAVGAAERAPAGVVRRQAGSRGRLEAAMREVFVVAAARGVALPEDAVTLAMQRMDALPEDATSSMQRDLLAGRPSELHELIGAVVRFGRESRVATPVSDALYAQLASLDKPRRPPGASGPA